MGDEIKKGETLAVGFTNNEEFIETAQTQLGRAFSIAAESPDKKPMVTHRVDTKGIHKI